MTSKQKLYKLLSIVFITLRYDAHEKSDKKAFAITHDFHNLPARLGMNNPNYDKILEDLLEFSCPPVKEFIESNLKLMGE